jgi:Ca2+-dependent lipid-binding protein
MKDRKSCVEIYRSETIEKNLNPEWKPLVLPVNALTNGNVQETILSFEVFDFDSGSANDLIGSFKVAFLFNKVLTLT